MPSTIKIKKGKSIEIKKEAQIFKKVYNYHIQNSILDLHDSYAKHHTRVVGTPMSYFSLDLENSDVNPLYTESTQDVVYSKPYKIYGHVNWNSPDFLAREEGVYNIIKSALWLARKEVEDAQMPPPKAGDIVRFWDLPYFDTVAYNGIPPSSAQTGLYFDVQEVKDDAHIFDTPYFVGFRLRLKRNSIFGPETKLPTDNDGDESC